MPLIQLRPIQAQPVEAFLQLLRVEQAQHQFFAERGRQGRQPQFHLAAARQAALQPAILRSALFRDVHAPQVFQAADQRQGHPGGEGIDVVQQAVDTVAQLALLAAWFQVDIAGALLDGVLQQPVDDMHDVRVVGTGLGLALAKLQELFEFAQAG